MSSRLNLIDELEEDIDTCFRLMDGVMSETQRMSLYVEKSRVFFEKGAFNSSFIILQKIIKNTQDNVLLGCANRNLARLPSNRDDFEYYSNQAIEHFLMGGEKVLAIKVIFSLLKEWEGKDNYKALGLIDKAIELQSSDSSNDKEHSAALLQRKSTILIELGRIEEARDCIFQACSYRRGLLGGEANLHTSLVKAEYICELLGDSVKANEFKDEYQNLEQIIIDDEFTLTRLIADVLENGGGVNIDSDKIKISDDTSPIIKFGYVMAKYINGNDDFEKKIELLDKALAYSTQANDYLSKTIVLNEMAQQYANNGYFNDAIDKLYNILSFNGNNMQAFQNLVFYLIQEKRLKDASQLLKERIEKVGTLPNLIFTYAKVLFEMKDYQTAFMYFKMLKKENSLNDEYREVSIDDYISQCLEFATELHLCEQSLLPTEIKIDLSLGSISIALDDFSKSVSNFSRMQYWTKNDEGYKWAKNPETIAKHHLLQFLSARFGSALELVQEDRAGAGFIDLYLISNNGLKVVVELKMCGGGYSSTYAISGNSQIIHYLSNKETSVGFLMVFDSRTRDFSKGLKEFCSYGKYSIYTKIVDVRNVIEK